MGRLSSKLRNLQSPSGQRSLAFFCPGCKDFHVVPIESGTKDSWKWNQNVEAPTFFPSVDVKSGHYMNSHKPGSSCWCTYNKEHPEDAEDGFECVHCHSWVTDGVINFLTDCTHSLAGQSVPIPDLPGTE